MIPDLDIYRSANVLVKQHGPDAPVHAVASWALRGTLGGAAAHAERYAP